MRGRYDTESVSSLDHRSTKIGAFAMAGGALTQYTTSRGNVNTSEFSYIVVGDEISKTKNFEFVTLTGLPSKETRAEISRKVRTHAMRDYLRRQNQEIMTGIIETPKEIISEEPSQYKTRFKLDSWTHRTKTKAMIERQARFKLTKPNSRSRNGLEVVIPLPTPKVMSVSSDLDPFDTLSLKLGPLSQKLLVHYNTSYFMNSVAINAEGNFFSFVKTDPALFHSILYLVALHYNLKHGLTDSLESLYHGSEAFRLINQRLDDRRATFSDATLAAVAMLANKENLDGKYELSKMHMRGLEFMISSRGGVHNFSGVFQRIITWSDFCFSNVWNCQPSFPRLYLKTSKSSTSFTSEEHLRPSHLFGSQSPIVKIIGLLRTLTTDLEPSRIRTANRLDASTDIYNLEYEILLLNKIHMEDPEPLECIYSFEAVPLKTAAHLWLWLAIRELPQTSELLHTLVQRLQGSMESQLPGWWSSSVERRTWLSWILFVGCVAAAGRTERTWFVERLRVICQQFGFGNQEALKECLRKVLWQEAFCAGPCTAVWDEMGLYRYTENAILA